MTKVLAIAWKDLRSTMRNPPALAMMLLAPLALAGLLGFAFGGGDSFQIPSTKVAVASADVTPPGGGVNVGDQLVGVLTGEGLKGVLAVTRVDSAAAARQRVDDGKAAAAVIVPADFSTALFGSGGRQSAVELYENPTQALGDSIAGSVISQTLLDFNGARAAAAAAAALRAGGGGHDTVARAAAAHFFEGGGVSKALTIDEREPLAATGGTNDKASMIGLVLAGMMVFFMFFGASNVARTILTEDRGGTLPRLLTTPTSATTVLGGKFASVFLTVTVQTVVLLLAGRLLFGIDWGQLDAVVLLTLMGAAVASGLALLIISVVRTPAQAGSIGAGVFLVLALLGGNFTGTATTSGLYANVQRCTPNGWLLRGWDAAMRGAELSHVLAQLIVPLAFTAIFFAVAALQFRRRYS
jgi:ABC-2 type transport system permease protein